MGKLDLLNKINNSNSNNSFDTKEDSTMGSSFDVDNIPDEELFNNKETILDETDSFEEEKDEIKEVLGKNTEEAEDIFGDFEEDEDDEDFFNTNNLEEDDFELETNQEVVETHTIEEQIKEEPKVEESQVIEKEPEIKEVKEDVQIKPEVQEVKEQKIEPSIQSSGSNEKENDMEKTFTNIEKKIVENILKKIIKEDNFETEFYSDEDAKELLARVVNMVKES